MTEKFEPKKEKAAEVVEEALRSLEKAKQLMSPELQKEIRELEILESVGLESKQALKELLEDLDPDSDEAKYFQEVLKQIQE